mmetsp:Transcript_11327/g.21449  ORF Transcript_11327/g.21449 Transcript_11327/m.21449 type:complete len:1100 (-) Transcript_11327:128-3427(-)
MMVLRREHRNGAAIRPELLLRICVLGVAMLPLTPALHSAMKKSARESAEQGPITKKPDITSWRNGSVYNLTAPTSASHPSQEGEAPSKKAAAAKTSHPSLQGEPPSKNATTGKARGVLNRVRALKSIPFKRLLPPLQDGVPGSNGTMTSMQNSTLAGSHGRCKQRIEQPPSKRSVKCPAECPYIRPDTVNFCSFACVAKEDCDNRNPLTSFADPETMMCSLCEVPGCDRCGSRKDECARCSEGMVLDEWGKCWSKYRTHWHLVYVVLGSLAALVLAYLFILGRRPVVNAEGLKRAEWYRDLSKLRYEDAETHSFRPPPFFTNLATKNVSGIGVLLHFSWQLHLLIWAALMALSLSILAICLQHIPGLMAMMRSYHNPSDPDVLKACVENGKKDAKEAAHADRVFFYFVVAVYVISTLGCLLLMARHRKQVQRDDAEHDTMMDYAVYAEGLPIGSGETNLEERYTLFFKQAFPDLEIVGVSICWDHTSFDMDVDRVVSLHLAAEDMDLKATESRSMSLSRSSELIQSRSTGPSAGASHALRRGSVSIKSLGELLDAKETERISLCDPQLRCVDGLLLGRFSQPETQQEKAQMRKQFMQNALKKMRSNGSAYLVFNTQADREKALKKPPIFYNDFQVRLTKTDYEPESVVWQNKGRSTLSKLARVVGSIAILTSAIWFWAYFFYAPWANYVLSWSQVNGMRGGNFAHGTLLGLVITLGNQIMYNLCDFLATWVRFERRGSRDAAYVSMYTFSIFINTVLDLWMVLVLAYGYKSDAAWNVTDGKKSTLEQSGVLSANAISHNPSIQDALYVELVAYLYPGTLLIPYVIEPIVLWLVPYYLYSWLIRSTKGISLFDAEGYLVAFPFELSRYGDIVSCVSVCVLVFFVASSQMWIVFVYLLSMLVFVYIWDHCRLLRISQRYYCSSHKLDNLGVIMLGFPSGLMASCVVFRLYGTHVKDEVNQTVQYDMFYAFALHTVLYAAAYVLITKLIPTYGDPVRGQPYAEACDGIPCNWFNANYIHCLRTRYIHDMDEDDQTWCVPFKIGREYLLQSAPKLGCYFKGEQESLARLEMMAEKDLEDIGETFHVAMTSERKKKVTRTLGIF